MKKALALLLLLACLLIPSVTDDGSGYDAQPSTDSDFTLIEGA